MLERVLEYFSSQGFMPHGHCYLWRADLLALNFWSDILIGVAYLVIASLLYMLVRKLRLPFSWVFIAFGLFIALCGGTHFMEVWTIWTPDYWTSGIVKAACAVASVATGIGLLFVRPHVEEVVHAARLSEERRIKLESTCAELQAMYEKVKELDELKSQFFANVSHELRTPLTLIIGPANQLLANKGLSDDQQQSLNVIRRNARILLNQVNDLLDIAKLEAGKMQMNYAEVDCAAWFRLVCASFHAIAETRHIDFQVATPAQLTAQLDPDKLERVLVNLLSNAFRFVPEGGRVQAALQATDMAIELSVSDSGPGISAQMQDVIFERFRQADGSITRQHGGTGLGLAIAKDFVELHRGTIAVSNAAQGGAVFLVNLPRLAPSGAAVIKTPAPSLNRNPMESEVLLSALASENTAKNAIVGQAVQNNRPLILVVEDNNEIREFIASLLSDAYYVQMAVDGENGIELAEALRPDVIISDVMMPGISGEQLVNTLRAQPAFAATPIILLTAKADDELKIKLLRQGVQDYITKPFLPDELRARVANWISVKQATDSLQQILASTSSDLAELSKQVATQNSHLQAALHATALAREQAERASEVKSSFLGMISHELRTPLSAMQLSLQVMLRDKTVSLPAPLKLKLGKLQTSAQQMYELIEGLLEYTRIRSGRILTHVEMVDLPKLVQETIDAYSQYAQEKNIEIQQEMSRLPVPALKSDPHLLRVILGNLISNAIKFTQQGKITVSVTDRDGQASFIVKDTGPGIPKEALGKIFEPFEQLEPVQRKTIPGAGLGLTLVKKIVEALGGTIEVDSEPGRGSAFQVMLARQIPS